VDIRLTPQVSYVQEANYLTLNADCRMIILYVSYLALPDRFDPFLPTFYE